MARKLRIEFPGALYHVINRGNCRRDVFETAGAAQAFVTALEEATAFHRWRVHAYVVMRNHYHLVLETPEPNLVAGMHWLQSTLATRFNRYREEHGHLFQGRYQALLIEDMPALANVVDHVHLNPVRAHVVPPAQVAAFRWSSLHRFVRGTAFPGLDASGWLGIRTWPQTPAGWSACCDHLKALAEDAKQQKELGWEGFSRGWAIGTAAWRRALAKDHAHLTLHPGLEADVAQSMREAGWEAALAKSLLEHGRTEADLAREPKGARWKLDLALDVRRSSNAPFAWLARKLHAGTPDSLRSLLSRTRFAVNQQISA